MPTNQEMSGGPSTAVAHRERAAGARPRHAVRGARVGWIRPPRRPRVADRWPGDVTAGDSFVAASLPAWVNGARRRPAVARLAFADASLLVLAGTYLLMATR